MQNPFLFFTDASLEQNDLDRSSFPLNGDIARIFAGLSSDILKFWLPHFELKKLPQESILFFEGEECAPGKAALFLVLEGELVAYKTISEKKNSLYGLGPGDICGENTLLDMKPRELTVQARTNVQVLKITGHHLDVLYRYDLKSYSLFLLNLAREVARKLRYVSEALPALLESSGGVLDTNSSYCKNDGASVDKNC